MDYLRGKLRGKTPSWGRSSETPVGDSDRAPSSFWSRRDSGGSISSLWSRSSRSRNDSTNDWKISEDRDRGAYRRASQSDYMPPSPLTTPKIARNVYSATPSIHTTDSPWRAARSVTSQSQTPTNDYPWRSRSRASPSPGPPDRRYAYARSPPPPSRPPPPIPKTFISNENPYYSEVEQNMNYKELFEKEKQEKELYGAKLAEMEQQHQILENNLKKFLDLKKELRSFQQEAEESDKVVNDFIKAVVPDFTNTNKKRSKKLEQEEEENEHRNKMEKSPGRGRPPLPNPPPTPCQRERVYRANVAQADPDLPTSPSPTGPPLPTVNYEWDDAFTSPTPIGRYTYSTTSRCSSRLDELKLNLVFDVNSKQLPTKLQLEIKDKKGRVVFKKRQNLYYVKVQERVSTLDAADDYVMTVTTICGPSKTSEDVTIHNKYYVAQDETEPVSMTESCTIPMLESVDMCRSPSEVSVTSGFDERSIDSIFDTPIRQIEATYDEVCREISETPLPDLEEIVEVDFAPAMAKTELVPPLINNQIEPEVVVVEKKNPFHLVKKPIVPEVVYKWQRGFRRDNSGRYCKVTILKIQFKYEESQKLLPSSLIVTNQSCKGAEEREKTVTVSDNSAVVEFLIEDISEDTSTTNFTVSSVEKQGDIHLTAPGFSISAQSLREVTLGDWHLANPVIILQL